MKISREELQGYVDLKMSQASISRETGIPEPTIAWTMRRYGIESKLKPKPKETEQTLRRLYVDEGLSIMAIAKRLGRSDRSISKWMREYGIDSRPRGTNQSGAPMTSIDLARRIARHGHRLLGEYRGWGEKVDYVCACGNTASSFPSVLTGGGRCKACASAANGMRKRVPASRIERVMSRNGDKFIRNYVDDRKTRVVYVCRHCDTEADVLWINYSRGQKCGGCRKLSFTRENNPNWNPILTDEEREGLGRYEEGYKSWARKVKRRDNYTCRKCGVRGGCLVSHHILSYMDNPELRTDMDNGVTLCEPCHMEFHSRFGYGENTEQQFSDFITQR